MINKINEIIDEKKNISFEQLTEAYNRGYIVDEVYKYGLELYGFDIFSNGLEDLVKRSI